MHRSDPSCQQESGQTPFVISLQCLGWRGQRFKVFARRNAVSDSVDYLTKVVVKFHGAPTGYAN